MRKILQTLVVMAALLPCLALAQPEQKEVYDQDEQARVRAHSETLEQDSLQVSSDQAAVTRDQSALDNDRLFLKWWAVQSDAERVRQDKLQLDRDNGVYVHDAGPADYGNDESGYAGDE